MNELVEYYILNINKEADRKRQWQEPFMCIFAPVSSGVQNVTFQ